jgi:hypothetical protein
VTSVPIAAPVKTVSTNATLLSLSFIFFGPLMNARRSGDYSGQA